MNGSWEVHISEGMRLVLVILPMCLEGIYDPHTSASARFSTLSDENSQGHTSFMGLSFLFLFRSEEAEMRHT